MPPLPSPGAVIDVLLQSTLGTDTDVQNHVFLSYSSGTPSITELNAFAAAVMTHYASDVLPNLSSDISLKTVVCTDLSSSLGARGEATGSHPGLVGTASVPAGSALVIRLSILRRYRGGKPRVYLAGVPAAALSSDQTWNPAEALVLANDWSSFVFDILADATFVWGTGQYVNVSYFEGFTAVENPITHRYRNIPTPRVTPLVDDILDVTFNPNVASQRRRNQQRSVR